MERMRSDQQPPHSPHRSN
jgi:transposase